MDDKTEYELNILINEKKVTRVIIDQHYKIKHNELNDDDILNLVKKIDGKTFLIEDEKDGYEYFSVEPIFLEDRPYRLILLLYVFDDFLGVVNAFRVQRKNYE